MRYFLLIAFVWVLPATAQDVEWVSTGALDYARPLPPYELIDPEPDVFVDEAGRALLSFGSATVALRLDGEAWEPFSVHDGGNLGVVDALGDTLLVTLSNLFTSGTGQQIFHQYDGTAGLWSRTQPQELLAWFTYYYDGFIEAFASSPGGGLWFGIQNYRGAGSTSGGSPPEGSKVGVTIGTASLGDLGGSPSPWSVATLPDADVLHTLVWTRYGPLVATDAGLYAQTGEAWACLAFAGMDVRSIVETDAGTLLAGVENALYRSTNGGVTWTAQEPFPGPTEDLLDAGAAVLATVESSGVFRSLDDGITWMPTGLTSSSGALAGLPAGPYYAAAPGATLYRSEDGIAWEPASYATISRVSFLVSTMEGIVAQASDRLYRYAGDTSTWQRLNLPDPGDYGRPAGFFVDPEGSYYVTLAETTVEPPHVYTFARIFKSSDAGTSWQYVNGFLSYRNSRSLSVTEAGTLLYVATPATTIVDDEGSTIHRSTDDGATWTPVLPNVLDIRFIKQSGSGTVRAISETISWTSTDDGETWVQRDLPFTMNDFIEQADGGLVAAAADGVWLAAGDGEPWALSPHQYPTQGIIANPAGDLFIRASQCADDAAARLCRSTDGGMSWPAFESPPLSAINAFALDQDGVLFVGGDFGVFRTLQTTVDSEDGATPSTAMTVYPNPASHTATLRFATALAGRVTITVFDVLGRTVTTLHDADVTPGSHDLQWVTADHAGGVYFVRVVTPSAARTLPVTVVR